MNDIDDALPDLVARVAALLERRGAMLATAESCTGGLIAAACTERAGSSAWFDRGFVTYSNTAKTEMIGVSPGAIEADGAVSEIVARRMAEGALRASRADVAIAVTGIAGPGGGSADKPVGLVHLALADKVDTVHRRVEFGSIGREAVRLATVAAAFELLRAWIEQEAYAEAVTGP